MTLADDAIQQLDRLGAVILDDLGDGPRVQDLAAAASAARDAVAKLSVPALTQLTRLVSGVADSLAGGGTEWNTALGGTLMAAVDDLRHLANRASEFSDEDSEHLHHRAAELSIYVVAGSADERDSAHQGGNAGVNHDVNQRVDHDMNASVTGGVEAAPSAVSSAAISPATSPGVAPSAAPIPTSSPSPSPAVVPISDLFYADAGPHIVSGGTPEAAAKRSDLLGMGIDALDNLTIKPIAAPATFGATEIVPVETLLYRGRAALERAAVIREQIKSSGGTVSPAVLDEMYDLIDLALKD